MWFAYFIYSPNSDLCRAKVLNFDEVQLSFLMDHAFDSMSKNSLPNPGHKDSFYIFFPKSCIVL